MGRVQPVVQGACDLRSTMPVDNEFVKHSLPVETCRVRSEWNRRADITCRRRIAASALSPLTVEAAGRG